jgi:hypothetical protein
LRKAIAVARLHEKIIIFLQCKDEVAWWLRHSAINQVEGLISDEVIFSIYLILPAALGPGVHSASNRNEYQKHKSNDVSGE